MNSAQQTESTKLRNENCTIHIKRTRISNILIFSIFKIKWPKSEEKLNFGGRWVWLSEPSPTQNFVVTPWPWPHLCRPAAAASAGRPLGTDSPRIGPKPIRNAYTGGGGEGEGAADADPLIIRDGEV